MYCWFNSFTLILWFYGKVVVFKEYCLDYFRFTKEFALRFEENLENCLIIKLESLIDEELQTQNSKHLNWILIEFYGFHRIFIRTPGEFYEFHVSSIEPHFVNSIRIPYPLSFSFSRLTRVCDRYTHFFWRDFEFWVLSNSLLKEIKIDSPVLWEYDGLLKVNSFPQQLFIKFKFKFPIKKVFYCPYLKFL